jgi:hypothetical protein
MIATEFGMGEQMISPMAQSGLGCRDDRIERSSCWNGNGLKDNRGRVEAESEQTVGK